LLLILLTIAALSLSPQRPKPSEVLLFLATLYATLKTQRNGVLLALVAVPLMANYFQIWLDSSRFGKFIPRSKTETNPRLALVLIVGFLLPAIPFVIKLKSTVYGTPTQESLKVPVKAIDYLKQNGITGNTFTDPNVWGAYVLWAAPNNPVYIDGRDVYPDTFVKEYVDIIMGARDWKEPFDQRAVKIAVLEPDSLLARELGESSRWERIYQDDVSVVYRRR